MAPENSRRKKHKNDEKTVRCPAKNCDEEVLARGLHLHVLKSSGDGHGEHNEIPVDMDLDEAEEVGSRKVEMNYPEERETEQVARMCPYCERPFRGKNGVMIHLAQTAGRKNHPDDAPDRHDLDDFPVVEVDDNENIVEVMDEPETMPSTEERREGGESGPDRENIKAHIEELREQGLDEQAEKAEEMLLDN